MKASVNWKFLLKYKYFCKVKKLAHFGHRTQNVNKNLL